MYLFPQGYYKFAIQYLGESHDVTFNVVVLETPKIKWFAALPKFVKVKLQMVLIGIVI